MEDQGKRIVMFVVLAAAIFIGWQWLFPQKKDPPRKPAAAVAAEQQGNQSPVWGGPGSTPTPTPIPVAPGTPADPAAPAPVAPAPATIVEAPLVPEQTLELTAKNMSVTFSNIGAVVKRVHRGDDPMKGPMNDDLFMSNTPGIGLVATTFINSTYMISPRAGWTGEKLSETQVRYTLKTPDLTIVKQFELLAADWIVKVSIDATLPEGAKATQQLVVSVFGIAPVVENQKPWRNKPGANCNMGGDVKTTSVGALNRGPRLLTGRVRYFGVATPFFMFGLSPKAERGEQFDCNAYPLNVEGVKDGVQVDLVYPPATGDAPIHEQLLAYFGPKYLDKLEGADSSAGYTTGFKESIHFGWFGFISRPLLWLLRNIYTFVGNWGIAIILLTMIVKLATLYWTTKSMRSMRAMSALKPEMDALQKRFPDDRAKQQQAQMELFKRHGVNPLSGCLPMLLQMPIWMGLYRMLSHVGELHQAVFIPGWLNDLTLRDPYYILPVALTGLMFLQSRIQPATGDSMQQKMIQYGMPLMFGVMGLWFPSGLTVYITTNTVLGILHALYMKRSSPLATPPAAKKVEAVEVIAAGASKKKTAAKPVIDVEANEADEALSGSDDDSDDDGGDGDAPKSVPRSNGASPGASGAGQQRRGKRRAKKR